MRDKILVLVFMLVSLLVVSIVLMHELDRGIDNPPIAAKK